MEFRAHEPRDASAIEHLFSSVFAEAEGKSEGTLIGTLARDLLAETVPHDLYGFVAVEQGGLVGATLFSRLRFENDPENRPVFLMVPKQRTRQTGASGLTRRRGPECESSARDRSGPGRR